MINNNGRHVNEKGQEIISSTCNITSCMQAKSEGPSAKRVQYVKSKVIITLHSAPSK